MRHHHGLDFIIGGAQKSGTTVLHYLLDQHEGVQFGPVKEQHLFDKVRRLQRPGEPKTHNLEDVRQIIANRFDNMNGKLIGDATPVTMWLDGAPEGVAALNPNTKWVICLRDPVDRLISQFRMSQVRGLETLKLTEALLEEAKITQSGEQNYIRSYVSRGLYSRQIERLYRLFGVDHILVLTWDHLQKEPLNCLRQIWKFLDLPEMHNVDVPTQRLQSYAPSAMENISRKELALHFYDDLPQLNNLQIDMTDWISWQTYLGEAHCGIK